MDSMNQEWVKWAIDDRGGSNKETINIEIKPATQDAMNKLQEAYDMIRPTSDQAKKTCREMAAYIEETKKVTTTTTTHIFQ